MNKPEHLAKKPHRSAGYSEPGRERYAFLTPFVLAGVLATFCVAMLRIGGASPSILDVVTYFLGALVLIGAGFFFLRLVGLDALPARGPVAIVVGAIATSLSVLAGVFITGFRAGPVFVGWSVVVAAALIATRHRPQRGGSSDILDCTVVAAFSILVAFWCRHAAATIPELKVAGVLPVWTDYYIHAATISQFGSSLAAGRGSIELVDQTLALYHYGGFMIAAAIQGVADLPGLGLASAILLPVGLLLAALGSYALAATLAGPLAGVIAIAFLTVVPDASFYGLANGFLGFHWMLFTAPGSGYALGAAAVAIMFANEWLRTRNGYALAAAFVLVATVFQLRALFLPILLVAFVGMLICDTGLVRRHARGLLYLALAAAALALILLFVVPPLRFFWLDHSAVVRFLEFVHQSNAPTGYDGLYARHIASVGRGAAVAFGTALLLPGILGAFVLIYPAALLAWTRRAGWQVIDLFPLLLVAAFLAVVIVAPVAPNGDASEFQHRHFVLVYQVVMIWTAAYLCRLLFSEPIAWSSMRALPATVAVTGLSILLGWLTGLEPGHPRFAWGRDFFRVPITPGVVDAAAFLRRTANPGETVVAVPVDPKATLRDRAIEIVGLTDLPSYLSRPGIQILSHRDVVTERLAKVGGVESAADYPAAVALLQRMGVTWYVRIGTERPRFDSIASHATFATGNATIYRVEPGETVR